MFLALATVRADEGWSQSVGGSAPLTLFMADSQNSLTFGSALAEAPVDAAAAMAYPGRYSFLDRQSLTLGHAQLFQGTSYNSVAYAYPTVRAGTFGVGVFQVTSPAADSRDASGKVTGSFTSSEITERLGYGSFIVPHLGWGVNLSNVQRQTAGIKSGFAAAAVGMSYDGIDRLSSSVALDNIAYRKTGTQDTLNPGLRVVNSYEIMKDKILIGADVTINPAIAYRFGVQYALIDGFRLRLGRSNTVSGVGLQIQRRGFQFEYNVGISDVGNSQNLGVSIFFGRPRSTERASSAQQHFDSARELAAQGRYADALASMRVGHRYKGTPAEMRPFEEGLAALVDGEVREMLGNGRMQTQTRKGISLYLEQKTQLARDTFLQVQVLDPRNIILEKLLVLPGIRGAGAAKDGESGAGLPKFTDVDPIKLKLFKSEQYFKRQEWDLALKEVRDVLAINPREVMAYVRLGSILYALGMKQKAVESWKYAESLNPSDPEVVKAVQFMSQMGLSNGGTP